MSQSIIEVKLPEKSYPIVIGNGVRHNLSVYLFERRRQGISLGNKVLVISNPTVFDHYGQSIVKSLEEARFSVAIHLLPDGEKYKTLSSIETLYNLALENRLERNSTLIALGGGVIGDMTGFAAATWLRGINFVQIPTSLLSMVDASIGGKTGVNHPKGKNLIGAFYQPRLVLIDPEVLQTLPGREFGSGMAEIIKYGVIWDQQLFEQLEQVQSFQAYTDCPPDWLMTVIIKACQAKAAIVSQDEREANLRALLNYGHTIGHVLESLTEYSYYTHGEAVALGMIIAGCLATRLGWWSRESEQRQLQLIKKANLPTQIPATLKVSAILDGLILDKKVKNGRINFILPTDIGQAKITDQVSSDFIEQAVLSRQLTSSTESEGTLNLSLTCDKFRGKTSEDTVSASNLSVFQNVI